jgi:uncharacterized protein (DUF1778 family)
MITAKKEARLELRLAKQSRKLIAEAASMSGQTMTEFVVGAAVESAGRVLAEERITRLTRRDSEQFVRILNAAKPNRALRAAARRFKRDHG